MNKTFVKGIKICVDLSAYMFLLSLAVPKTLTYRNRKFC